MSLKFMSNIYTHVCLEMTIKTIKKTIIIITFKQRKYVFIGLIDQSYIYRNLKTITRTKKINRIIYGLENKMK